jgi:UDP-N-acetylglucosamine:LPS N-acetylglucosamine transferase
MWRRADGESPRPKKVLAVASGGGHWIELLRVIKAFDGHDIRFVTVHRAYRHDVPGHRLHVVTDATRRNPFRVVVLAIQMLALVAWIRPSIVLSTGSAPGLFGLVFGRLLGARTIWLDSLANVDRVSLSGSLARPFAGLWLTQWPHLARPEGPEYAGQVL